MIFRSKKTVSDPTAKEATADASVRRKRKKAVKRAFFHTANVFVFIAAAGLLIASFLFPLMMISGDSMEPGLNDGDLILLMKTHELQHGDLVAFKWNNKTLLKRVIACAGDWVIIDKTGRVYVNGALLDEPYVSEYKVGESNAAYPLQVPDGSYFVMGDERASSLDSRNTLVGCVSHDQIIGKSIACIWKQQRTNAPAES